MVILKEALALLLDFHFRVRTALIQAVLLEKILLKISVEEV